MNDLRAVKTVAIIGAGLIGAGWATIFVNAGMNIRVYDQSSEILGRLKDAVAYNLKEMAKFGLAETVTLPSGIIEICSSIEDAVLGADYVQESVLETADVKREVSKAIDVAIAPGVFVGSSSSGIPASQFTEKLKNRDRFYVVHPVNPPHLIPVVEIVPAPWSDPAAIPALRSFMEKIGRKPVVLSNEIEGFILNRLQGALLNEAWSLFSEGYATTADIDRTISEGLGLRWSFMGPFETIDLNAPGGITDYAARLGELYHGMARSRTEPKRWSQEAISKAASEMQNRFADTSSGSRLRARDARLMALLAHKAQVHNSD